MSPKPPEFSTNASGVINFTRLGAGTYTVKGDPGADRLLQLRQAEFRHPHHR